MTRAEPAHDSNPFRMVSYEHAAQLMDVDVRTIKRLVAAKELPVHYVSPQCPRILWWAVIVQLSHAHGIDVQLAPETIVVMKH